MTSTHIVNADLRLNLKTSI